MTRYDKTYFESYGGTEYDWKNTYWVLRPFASSIINLLKLRANNKHPTRVLDIGCAKGYLVKMLRERNIEVWGVDASEYAIRNSPNDVKSYLRRINVEDEALPFQNKFFELVVSIATFEHLHMRRLPFLLLEIKRVLELGGLLIINVPNPLSRAEAKKPDHKTMLSKKGWIKLIENSSFHFEPQLTKSFDSVRAEEIASLYTSARHSFQLMNIHFYSSRRMSALMVHLIRLKRKFFAHNFSLAFCRV